MVRCDTFRYSAASAFVKSSIRFKSPFTIDFICMQTNCQENYCNKQKSLANLYIHEHIIIMTSGTIAAQLKLYMSRSGLKTTQVAARCGVADSTLSRIIHGKVKPSPETLIALAEVLKLTREDTLTLLSVSSPEQDFWQNLLLDLKEARSGTGKDNAGNPRATDVAWLPMYDTVPNSDEDEPICTVPWRWSCPTMSHKKCYCIKAMTDSMSPAIRAGETVVICREAKITNGSIVCVEIDGKILLKEMWQDGPVVTLVPRNKAFEPKSFSLLDRNSGVVIHGRVISAIRDLVNEEE